MKVDVRSYRPALWGDLRSFLARVWAAEHPILDERLFHWQYRGFGPEAQEGGVSLLLYDHDRISGFLGAIPGTYQVPGQKEVQSGVAAALWVVDDSLRNRGLGAVLMTQLERSYPVCAALGTNTSAARYFVAREFNRLDHLYRYVLPLEIDGYCDLQTIRPLRADIERWLRTLSFEERASPTPMDPVALAAVWHESTKDLPIFTLHRTAEFWRWRYLESAGFHYDAFCESNVGFVIARTESVVDEGRLTGLKVLRIIEVVPRDAATWRGETNPDLERLVRSVLGWSRKQGCSAADYQTTSECLAGVLCAAGFRRQDAGGSPPCSLRAMFQPLRVEAAPINAFWRFPNSVPGKSQALLMKSDGDMDRPNLWPLVD